MAAFARRLLGAAKTTQQGLINLAKPARSSGRVYCVGAAKTGTHTIGEMFADRLPSAHESDAERLIRLVLAREQAGNRDSSALYDFLRRRDRWRGLAIDASQVNIYLIDELETLFSDNRYVLTLRPPAVWLRSMIDDSLRRDTSQTWMQFRDFRFGQPCDSTGAEAPLAKAGLYSIDGYLGYWADVIERVLTKVPADRRLIVATTDIGPRARDIALFCGVPDPDRPPARAHSFQNSTRFGVLNSIDASYLTERLEAIAGPVARQVIPDWSPSEDLRKAIAG